MHKLYEKSAEKTMIHDAFLPLISDISFNLEDDVACYRDLIISSDSIIEGVHIESGANYTDIAHKLLARNLSDIASKGGTPLFYNLNIIMPKKTDNLQLFASGLTFLTSKYGISLIGGDIASHNGKEMIATMTIFGNPPPCGLKLRNGAKNGDNIYISGKIGEAYLGYIIREEYLSSYLRPVPQIEIGKTIAPLANAMCDVSDGLICDIKNIADASGLGFILDFNELPFAGREKSLEMLTFGDDYNILFTSEHEINMPDITKIGKMTSKERNILNFPWNLSSAGFSHTSNTQ